MALGKRRADPLTATVLRKERLSESMVRLVLGGKDLKRFQALDAADMYVKLVFPDPASPRPAMRTYTVRAWDPKAHEMTIDFVVHGDEGLAGPWARDAEPGAEVLIAGPGGGYSPEAAAEWHLMIGDESALPAIAVACEQLAEGARALVFVEVHGEEDELPLTMPASATLVWLHRLEKDRGDLLVDQVTTMAFPDGAPQVFLHGEAGWVRTLRRHLLVDRGVPRERASSVSGYWRLGQDDEAWRAVKREFSLAMEADTAPADVA